jgi:hypothetical protein
LLDVVEGVSTGSDAPASDGRSRRAQQPGDANLRTAKALLVVAADEVIE